MAVFPSRALLSLEPGAEEHYEERYIDHPISTGVVNTLRRAHAAEAACV
jgi:hypothetical protein